MDVMSELTNNLRAHLAIPIALLVIMAAIGLEVSTASGAQAPPLPPAALHRLVVAPAAPFVALPDSALKTGLMEFGNPKSGKIGTVVNTAQLKAANFQRGWETVFRTPDEAVA